MHKSYPKGIDEAPGVVSTVIDPSTVSLAGSICLAWYSITLIELKIGDSKSMALMSRNKKILREAHSPGEILALKHVYKLDGNKSILSIDNV